MVVQTGAAGADARFPLGRRGERPLRVAVNVTGTSREVDALVPGAQYRKGALAFSWEQVGAVQRVFGLDPATLPPLGDLTTLPLPGLEEYRQHFAQKLRNYQKSMVQFLALRAYAINADPMRCLSGKSRLTINRGGKAFSITMERLVRGLEGQLGWDLRIPTKTQSMDAQGSIVLNTITLAHKPGKKPCMRVQLSNGSVLECTAEHKLITPRGKVPLQDLHVGDYVLVTEGAWRRINGRAVPATIVSMEYAGEQEVFDLTMANPLNNYVAEGVVVSNSGKTPTTIAAASLVGSKKTLIVCPNIAKLVWATELVKWMQQPSVLLYGRGADEAREFCVPCNGTGRDSAGKHCVHCKAKNGQSYGAKLYFDRESAAAALASARFVICNYDILLPQMMKDPAGKRIERVELPGWYAQLRDAGFDLIIADEAHILRGRSKVDRIGESRRDKLLEVARNVERFWALSGTPVFGRVADLWSLLDVLTDGLFGRPFFSYDVRYANGLKGTYGWENNGATHIDELKSRLDVFMLKRDRREILPELPPKTRQVIRIDASKADFKMPKGKGTGGIHAALRVTANIKEQYVVDAVVDECGEGAKVVVFTYSREHSELLAKAIAAAGEKDVRLKSRNFRVWAVNGETSVEARFNQAKQYREWQGAAAFVATIESVPVAISLNGAQSVHFADLTFDPASLLQAEDRPYEVGSTGLTIVYYVVEKTIDERVLELVLPKMEMMEQVMSEQAAQDFRTAFGAAVSPEQMAEDIWARMTAAASL